MGTGRAHFFVRQVVFTEFDKSVTVSFQALPEMNAFIDALREETHIPWGRAVRGDLRKSPVYWPDIRLLGGSGNFPRRMKALLDEIGREGLSPARSLEMMIYVDCDQAQPTAFKGGAFPEAQFICAWRGHELVPVRTRAGEIRWDPCAECGGWASVVPTQRRLLLVPA